MARRRISEQDGVSALAAAVSGSDERNTLATATRFLLEELAERAPGKAVEVRVPPFGAVQCVGGLTHTRGTPPNVIEMDAVTWIGIATGRIDWDAAVDSGAVSASGSRADLAGLLPVRRIEP
ncbi:sterol carrier family protein [Leucobacter denitrificans]|uniref:Bacterial SCP orthologue domain-containing protein n=1 Tax=Leucobacter denitrificans TaxID=683042 RepID=A0A7G9S722_9MICO|nr:sterol carrier family protein [Leucobacter denitrificans]QNN63647.1 hypothetical protein H9L06_04925 [Leucobacter denitrificans]